MRKSSIIKVVIFTVCIAAVTVAVLLGFRQFIIEQGYFDTICSLDNGKVSYNPTKISMQLNGDCAPWIIRYNDIALNKDDNKSNDSNFIFYPAEDGNYNIVAESSKDGSTIHKCVVSIFVKDKQIESAIASDSETKFSQSSVINKAQAHSI